MKRRRGEEREEGGGEGGEGWRRNEMKTEKGRKINRWKRPTF